MMNLGNVVADSTIRIPFNSFNASGASDTMTGFAVGDMKIYKDGGTTERSSTNGYTATTDFDSLTGAHVAEIDLSDNSDAGFYDVGSTYDVAIDSVTIDGETVRFWAGRFDIQNASVGSRIKNIYRGVLAINVGLTNASTLIGSGVTVDPARCELALVGYSADPTNIDYPPYLTMTSTHVAGNRILAGNGNTFFTWQITEWE